MEFEDLRPTVLEINLENFRHNVRIIQDYIGSNNKIMPVIKANAYGTYINKNLDVINEFDILAVATVTEGIEIRNLGYEKEIFVLNQPYLDEVKNITKFNIAVGVSSIDFVKRLGESKEKVKIHIEIGTGMGRTGIHPNRADEFCELIKSYGNIEVEGIYTHLSVADIDEEYTKKQLASFERAVEVTKKHFNLKYIHSMASSGIINFSKENEISNLVRPGIILYGYDVDESLKGKLEIKPVAKLKSKVIFMKEVKEGTSIGYGRSYITTKQTKVGTVPLGYADGFRRTFSNKGKVYVNGKMCDIIGKVCMDSFMVDLTDVEDAKVGNDVIIFDEEHIFLDDLAKMCDTINYELLCTISERVKRKFVE